MDDLSALRQELNDHLDAFEKDLAMTDPELWGVCVNAMRGRMRLSLKHDRGMLMPTRMSTAAVAAILRDIANGLDSGSTDEGSIEFLNPPWGPGDEDTYDPDVLDVRGSIRTGRDIGQGGVAIIGEWEKTTEGGSDAEPMP